MENETELKREPLLSEEYLQKSPVDGLPMGRRDVIDFYEAKITKGELMMVKTATALRTGSTKFYTAPAHCSACHVRLTYYDEEEQEQPMPNFCHRCGSKIIEG